MIKNYLRSLIEWFFIVEDINVYGDAEQMIMLTTAFVILVFTFVFVGFGVIAIFF